MTKYNDYPIYECAKVAGELIARGVHVRQKFTCSNCGSRQTIEEQDVFYTSARCEDCTYVTDIQKQGCNYLAIASSFDSVQALMDHMTGGKHE
jgi:hypothetical protein